MTLGRRSPACPVTPPLQAPAAARRRCARRAPAAPQPPPPPCCGFPGCSLPAPGRARGGCRRLRASENEGCGVRGWLEGVAARESSSGRHAALPNNRLWPAWPNNLTVCPATSAIRTASVHCSPRPKGLRSPPSPAAGSPSSESPSSSACPRPRLPPTGCCCCGGGGGCEPPASALPVLPPGASRAGDVRPGPSCSWELSPTATPSALPQPAPAPPSIPNSSKPSPARTAAGGPSCECTGTLTNC